MWLEIDERRKEDFMIRDFLEDFSKSLNP